MKLTPRENMKRLVAHSNPERIAWDFPSIEMTDIQKAHSRIMKNVPDNPYNKFGDYPELRALTGFHGELRRDIHGNIYGRFEGKTKGECVRGVITDWDRMDDYYLPEYSEENHDRLLSLNLFDCDKYVVTSGGSLFSELRDARLMENALMDTVIYPDEVKAFMDKISDFEVKIIKHCADCGIDAYFMGDDWGTQERTFISPESFRELFKPYYKKISDAAHNAGMSVIMHSCGYNYAFINDFIEMGIDVLQFDQPDVYPAETLADEFGSRVSFYSPVDIQKIMPTGDKNIIVNRTNEMLELFKTHCHGSWIAKEYTNYSDINLKPEWMKWFFDTVINNAEIKY